LAGDLTKRQEEILRFIIQRTRESGYPPTVREIGKAVGLKSSSTVHLHLGVLEQKGYIKRDAAKTRAIIPLYDADSNPLTQDKQITQLPLVGKVAAGTPILAQENIEGYMPVPEELLGYGRHYILQVQGESMIEAGILDGDYLVVSEQPDANNGEIVVAMIDGEATVKRFYRHRDYVELRPANRSMQPIITREVVILGKVKGLFRKIQ